MTPVKMKSQSCYSFFLAVVFLIVITACKKDAGKHCPVIQEGRAHEPVDLSSVKDIPAIMDTLAAHPELDPNRVNMNWSIADPKLYTANVTCYIYYKDVIIFDAGCDISFSNSGYTYYSSALPIKVKNISMNPSINRGGGIHCFRSHQI